ncbi:hypothetical protein LTR10_007490 [Elasticomyces elasticus]|nr:hypothetical protein LTR10_007490 [Elasticomyces elasticus]KAK4979297.1 hypothetical protein LTR42_001800 [Elasticomyces elasticus]
MASDLSSNGDSWALMSHMLDIIKPYMPVPGHPLGNEIEDAILRELMSFCMRVSLASLSHNAEEQRVLARNCVGLFDLKGWNYFSGLEEAAAKNVSKGHEGEGDDLKPGTSIWMKHTGLHTDGTTCFQNSAFVALVSSPAFMRRLMNFNQSLGHEDVYLEPYMIAARVIVQDMLVALFQARKQDSLELLHQFWAAQDAAPAGSALNRFRPGDRHDPGEFLLMCLVPLLEDLVRPAWGLTQVEEVFCSRCHSSRERYEDTLNLFLPVPRPGTLDFVCLMNDYFLQFDQCNDLLLECHQCSRRTQHAQASRLEHDGKGDILVSLNVSEPISGSTDPVDMAEYVGLPFGAFPVVGPDCLFFVKYILAYKGTTTEERHFFGFDRGAPSMTGHAVLDGVSQVPESFDTFRKFDDACLTSNVSFAAVTREMPYQVLISPIRHPHFVVLCAREIGNLRTETVSTIASVLQPWLLSPIPAASFDASPILTATAAELSTIFSRVIGRELAKLMWNNRPVVTVSAAIWDRLLASPHLTGLVSVRRLERIRNGKGTMEDLFSIWAIAAIDKGWKVAMSNDDNTLAAACLHDIVFVPELVAAFLREVAHDHTRLQRETQRRLAVLKWKAAHPRPGSVVGDSAVEVDGLQSDAPTENVAAGSCALTQAAVDGVGSALVGAPDVGSTTASKDQGVRGSVSRRSNLRQARDSLFAVGRHLVRGLTNRGQGAKD